MNNKKQWQKAFFSAFVIWTMLVGSVPAARAQDIMPSEDLSGGGSSVFVFRSSRKIAQVKAGFRNNNLKGSTAQRAAVRKKVNNQAIAAVSDKRKKTPKVDPVTVLASNKTPVDKGKKGSNQNKNVPAAVEVKTVSNEQTSIQMAGAAETYLEKNDLKNAVEFFTTAIELNPKNENAKLGLSEAYTRMGDDAFDKTSPEAAVALYEKAAKFNNQNAAAYAGLGAAYEAADVAEKAVANYQKALAIDKTLTSIYAPLGLLYFQKGEIAQAEDYLTRATSVNAADPDTQYFLGLIRYKQNRNDEAIAAFKQTLASNASSAEAHYYLGEVYDRLNRDQEALSEYNQAVRLNPNYVDAWFDLGVANYNRGRYEEAAAAYKQVIRLKNDYGQAHANLADTYRQLAIDAQDAKQKRDFFGLANGSYTVAEAFIKNDAELYSNWGFCLGRVQHWENAVKRLSRAVEISPDAADYSNIGWAYHNSAVQDFQFKREAEAKVKLENGKIALQKAIDLKPKFFAALHNLGSVLLDLGDNQGAVNALKIASELRKDFVPTILSLGVAYRQINDLGNAVKYFKRTTELNDSSALGWFYLGEAEFKRGNAKEAKKAQEKLQKLGQGSMANRLDVMLKNQILTNPKNKFENKIQEKNPLKNIPKPY